MPALRASFVPSPITRAVIDGTARPRGIDLDIEDNSGKTVSAIVEANSKRMVAGEDLDVAEMSFGTFTRARDLGAPILALPVFPGRRFLHPAIVVKEDSPIQAPADLRGKRAAIGQFWQTAAIWHRVLLNSGGFAFPAALAGRTSRLSQLSGTKRTAAGSRPRSLAPGCKPSTA